MTKTKHLTKILQQPQVYKSNPKGFNIKTILKKTYRSDIHLSLHDCSSHTWYKANYYYYYYEIKSSKNHILVLKQCL